MDWLIFGDDWGGHPSTTQHLARNLPPEDRIIWINSIGMRSPDIHLADLRRLCQKAFSALRGARNRRPFGMMSCSERITVIPPVVLPWHQQPLVRSLNARSLHLSIRAAMKKTGMERMTVLVSNPMAVFYLEGLPCECLCYLRLDDYPNLPGVDASLTVQAEALLMQKSQLLFATATLLLSSQIPAHQHQVYLPQGVDRQHFASVPLDPPRSRVLGFYGLLAEWLNYPLIEQVADSMPGWTLEMIGPVRCVPERLHQKPNIRLLPPVSYCDLPEAIRGWDAAWIPFQLNSLTQSVNPLKLREYLAAGLPTLCTPLPEAQGMSANVTLARTPEEVRRFLESVVETDTAQKRAERRHAVAEDGWDLRVAVLRAQVARVCGAKTSGS